MSELTTIVDQELLDYDFITIIGNLNNNLLVTKSDVNKHLIEFMNSQVMSNIIKMPTCFKTPWGTLLDVIITTYKYRYLSSGAFNTGLSDFHHLTYGVLRTGFPKSVPHQVKYKSYKTYNDEEYKTDLAQAPFQVTEIFEDVDNAQWYVDTLHKQILDQHVPIKSRVIIPNKHTEKLNYKLGFGAFLTVKTLNTFVLFETKLLVSDEKQQKTF